MKHLWRLYPDVKALLSVTQNKSPMLFLLRQRDEMPVNHFHLCSTFAHNCLDFAAAAIFTSTLVQTVQQINKHFPFHPTSSGSAAHQAKAAAYRPLTC